MSSWLEPLGRSRARRARHPVSPRAPEAGSPNEASAWPRRATLGSNPVPVPSRFRAIFAAMNASIVRLDSPLAPDLSVPPAERVLSGAPEHRVWNYFTDSTQTFFAGRWSGSRGKWRVRYTENELCVMTEGRVVITSDAGERNEFGPGDAFVIPAGFSGTWEVLEDCSKVYAIFEPRS